MAKQSDYKRAASPIEPAKEPETVKAPTFEEVTFNRHVEDHALYGSQYLDQVKAHPHIDNAKFAVQYGEALAKTYGGDAALFANLVLNYINA